MHLKPRINIKCRLALKTSFFSLPSVQIQTAAPPWVLLVSYYLWVNGPCLSLLFSFSWVYRPCLQPSLLPQPTPLPRTHSSGPPGSVHFMPFTLEATNLSLSFLCHPSLCTLSRSAWCTLSHLQNLWCQFLSVGALFVSPPSAPPFISVLFFFLSCSVCSSFSHLSLLSHFFPVQPPICLPFLFHSKSPKVLYWCSVQFIANTFLMVEV